MTNKAPITPDVITMPRKVDANILPNIIGLQRSTLANALAVSSADTASLDLISIGGIFLFLTKSSASEINSLKRIACPIYCVVAIFFLQKFRAF